MFICLLLRPMPIIVIINKSRVKDYKKCIKPIGKNRKYMLQHNTKKYLNRGLYKQYINGPLVKFNSMEM